MALLTWEQLQADWRARAEAAGVDMNEFSMEIRYTNWGSRVPVFVKNPEEFCYAEKDGHKCSKPLDHEGSHMKSLYWK
jgi:hypothetical protein